MDTHPIQASPQRWIVALGLLLVAGVQGLFLWGYTDDGIWVSLLDGMAATLLFALSAYWAWYVLGFVHYYAFYHYIRHILYFGGQFLYPVDLGVY